MATRGWNDVTAADAARHALKHARRPIAPVRMPRVKTSGRSKYGAVKTVVDGVTFDSKAEAGRYSYLKALERTGYISALVLQPVIPLLAASVNSDGDPSWVPTFVANYVADFRYRDADGRLVFEDVKGFKTPLYRLKKKFAEACTGVQISEIR